MKTKLRTLILVLFLGGMTALFSCEGNDDCPNQSFNSLADCEDATDGKLCFCVQEGGEWKAVPNI